MTKAEKSSEPPRRIAIVDDHPAVRDGLALRIGIEPDLAVCWEASDLPEALSCFQRERPDLAVIDITLKSGNGIDLIKQVKSNYPEVLMLVWSMHNDLLYAERVLHAGACGYINKEHSTSQIVDAIRDVLQGNVYLSAEMNARILKAQVGGEPPAPSGKVEQLSDRELEIFTLIGQGLGTHEIAKKIFLSPKTVETYRTRIKSKLGIADLNQLTREAVRWVLEKE